jgi:PST family polysaccharide transporter
MGAAEQPSHAEPKHGYAATAASGSAWTTAQSVFNKLLTMAASILLARMLAPSDYGLAFFVANAAVFAFVFPAPVMADVLLADRRRFQKSAGAANVVVWIGAAAMFLLLAGIAIPIERFDGRAGLALLIFVASLRPLADAVLAVANARIRMDLEYRRIALIDGAVMIGSTSGSLILAYLDAGAVALTLPPIMALAFRGVLYWRVVRGRVDLSVDRSEIKPVARRYMVAGLGQYVHNILLALEIVVLGLVASEYEVGLFVLATTYAIQANTMIAGQLGSVLQPIFAHVQEDPERQISGFLRATRLLSSIAVPLSLMQAAIAIPFFSLLFSEQWTGSIAIFVALSVAQAFVFVSAPAIALLKAQGRFRAYLSWQLMQLITATVGFAAAVVYGGPIALRLATGIGLPIDENSGRAVALSIASALVWAMFCPLAVWLGGRPARLGLRPALGVFFEPWTVSLPIAGALVGCWMGLRSAFSPTVADALTITLAFPVAALIAIAGCVWMRESTRADIRKILGRFFPRKA